METVADRNVSHRPGVLLVDDKQENLFALEAMLRRDDVEILTASSGRAALELLLKRPVAVAIIDVMMPEMDGFELAELIRGVERTRRVPIIFVTAGSDAEYRVFAGYETGAIDFLLKPVNDRVLQAKVDVLVALEKQRQEIDLARKQAEQSRAETESLFRLAQATSHSEAPEQLFEPAFEAVQEIIGAARAAVLLFDETGRLRLRSVRGLPSDFDPAVALEAHLPWPSDDVEPQPVVISNVADDASVAAYREIFVEAGISSIGFIPLVSQRELLGTLTLFWNQPITLSEHETHLASTIASLVADAMQRMRLRSAERNARREAEAAEERLRVALEAGRMGVWEWTIATGGVTWWPRLETIHGFEAGTFPGTVEAWKQALHPDDRRRVIGAFREAIEQKTDPRIEYRIVRRDGETRWVEGHAKLLSSGSQEDAPSVVGVTMDVTERKELEQAREAVVAELEQTLRYNEIFAGILAHDLRGPLGAVLMGAQVVLLSEDRAEERATQMLHRIIASGERMTRMIDQLLDFTRARVGNGFPLEPRLTDLGELCAQVINETELAHPRWRISFESMGDLRGSWDPDRLLQAVSNLIANAGEHGASGGPIRVKVDGTDKSTVRFEVHNGGHIPEWLLPKLFAPFRGGRERSSKGLGLGLFITREIVRSHGGTIEVASSETGGTTFEVRLPRETSLVQHSRPGDTERKD